MRGYIGSLRIKQTAFTAGIRGAWKEQPMSGERAACKGCDRPGLLAGTLKIRTGTRASIARPFDYTAGLPGPLPDEWAERIPLSLPEPGLLDDRLK